MVNSMMNSMVNWGMVNNSMVDRGMDSMMKYWGVDSMMYWGMDSMMHWGMDSMMYSSWGMSNKGTTCKSSKGNLSISRHKGYKSSQSKNLHDVDV